MKIRLIAQLIKKTLYKMSKYFPKPYEPFGGDINVKVGLLDYATIADRKKKKLYKLIYLIYHQNLI